MSGPDALQLFGWRGALVFAAATTLAACTAGEAVSGTTRYVVTAERAQFYKYGPAQTFGADFVLPKGEKLTMLQRSFGYSRVTTEAGVTGYVATEEVAPAPPEVTPVPEPRSSGGGGRRSNVLGTPGLPLFDVNDVPTPLPTDPEPRGTKADPKFRY